MLLNIPYWQEVVINYDNNIAEAAKDGDDDDEEGNFEQDGSKMMIHQATWRLWRLTLPKLTLPKLTDYRSIIDKATLLSIIDW